ncbi:unnamed protein product [Blepharisma stoltei]|uniref:Uncharacterized protein n=1 Tax=Blepharisma stoltei TaxID=1481888 RepID=A0AAU9JR33_9CILI|nr:unnamed protein product [Blepharisma stoltei]
MFITQLLVIVFFLVILTVFASFLSKCIKIYDYGINEAFIIKWNYSLRLIDKMNKNRNNSKDQNLINSLKVELSKEKKINEAAQQQISCYQNEVFYLTEKCKTLEMRMSIKEKSIQKLEERNALLCKDLALKKNKSEILELSTFYTIEGERPATERPSSSFEVKVRNLSQELKGISSTFDSRNTQNYEKNYKEDYEKEIQKNKKCRAKIRNLKKQLKDSAEEISKIRQLQLELQECRDLIEIKVKNNSVKEQKISELNSEIENLKSKTQIHTSHTFENTKEIENNKQRIKDLENENFCLSSELAELRFKVGLSEKVTQTQRSICSRTSISPKFDCRSEEARSMVGSKLMESFHDEAFTHISALSKLMHKLMQKAKISEEEIRGYMKALEGIEEYLERII